jgi:hypothetical protein
MGFSGLACDWSCDRHEANMKWFSVACSSIIVPVLCGVFAVGLGLSVGTGAMQARMDDGQYNTMGQLRQLRQFDCVTVIVGCGWGCIAT